MPDAVQCPQCGSSDCVMMDNGQCQCRNCQAVFMLPGNDIISPPAEVISEETRKKQATNIILGVIFMFLVFGYGIWSTNKSSENPTPTDQEELMIAASENEVGTKYTESTQSFLAVPGTTGTEIWCIKRRNSSNLKEVDFRLSIEDPITRKELYTRPVISTMTWEQSFDKNFQISPIKKAGSRCWLIIGDREIVGYDISSRQKTVENTTLMTQFHQFSEGVSKVYALNNISGFKVSSKEGFTYYYLPEENKVLTEVEYDNVRRNENTNNTSWAFQSQYVFSNGEKQQLYKLVRRQQNLRMRKIFPEEVQNILNDGSLWYRKMYNVVSIEEFTPGKIYYRANVLFYDNEYCVFICTADMTEKSAILVQCIDNDRKIKWTLSGEMVPEFKDFLNPDNIDAFRIKGELVFQIPYQTALCVDMNTGKVLWKYKAEAPV